MCGVTNPTAKHTVCQEQRGPLSGEPYTRTSNKQTDLRQFVGDLHPQPDPLSTTDPDDSQHWFVVFKDRALLHREPVLPCRTHSPISW